MIKPMLCEDLEVNDIIEKSGLDGEKVTIAYREAIAEALRKLMVQGYLAERKGAGLRRHLSLVNLNYCGG